MKTNIFGVLIHDHVFDKRFCGFINDTTYGYCWYARSIGMFFMIPPDSDETFLIGRLD